jgi:hypothetical protein
MEQKNQGKYVGGALIKIEQEESPRNRGGVRHKVVE